MCGPALHLLKPILKHAQELGAGGTAGPDVEVPQVEVLRAAVQQPYPVAERQNLVCRSNSAWANCCQRDAHQVALATAAAGPDSHRLRGVGRGRTRRLALDHHGVRGARRDACPAAATRAGPPSQPRPGHLLRSLSLSGFQGGRWRSCRNRP